MRWFIVFLIVANVILYFWMQQESRPVSNGAALSPPEIGRLRLLSELDVGTATAVAPATSSVPPIGAPIDLTGEQPSSTAPPLVAPSDPGPTSLGDRRESAVQDAVHVEDAVPERIDQSNQGMTAPVVAESIVENAALSAAVPNSSEDSLATSTGQEPEAVPEIRTEVPEPVVIAAPPASRPQCARIGPLRAEDADRLVAQLPSGLVLYSDVTEEVTRIDGYYAIIPKLPSREAGNAKLGELAAAGVKDTWLFRAGEWRNAISLGLFKRESNALRHAQAIADKGFETTVAPKTSVAEERWLYVKGDVDTPFSEQLPALEGVSVETRDCP